MRSQGKLHFLRGFCRIALAGFILSSGFACGRNLFAQASPVLIGADTNYMHIGVGAVAVAGNYAYACSSRSGFFIYNISNPNNPVTVWQDGSIWTSISISGNRAYVANGSDGFAIYDISNPTNSISIGSFAISYIQALAVSGNYLYLADGPDGLRIFDISDPTLPLNVGHIATGVSDARGFLDVAVSNDHAYLHGQHGSVWIFNVSDPTNPVNVSTMGNEFEYQNPGRMTVSAGYAYISTLTNALYIFDVSNPTNPAPKGKVACGGTGGAIALSGNYVYLANGVLSIVDVSNPQSPLHLASTGNLGSDYFEDVAVAGNYAYIAANYVAFSIYSLGAPSPPPLRLNRAGANTLLSWPTPMPAFAVQQNSDLKTRNWVTLTNTVTTVSGRNQVLLPSPGGNQFYRLKQL
jgi:hypothetical protein